MRRIWAVARQTFAQCLRMKVAVAFILLLAVALAAIPSQAKGDGTLAGKIRTLLDHGTVLTALLLSLVTVFVSVAVVASDVAEKQVFLVATKPLPRWQYVLGRWLGVVMLDIVLLACAGAAVYASAQVLRTQAAVNPADRAAVETEVFAARRRISPAPPDIAPRVEARIARLKEEGRYDEILETYRLRTGGNNARAEQWMLTQIREEEATAAQSVPLGGVFQWQFEGIRVTGQEQYSRGTITEINPVERAYRIEARPRLLGALVYQGPVRVEGVDGKVVRIEGDFFEVQFDPEDARRPTIANLTVGREVELVADPTIQVTFKIVPAVSPAGKLLPGVWQLINPSAGLFYQEVRNDRISEVHTMTVSARLVDPSGRTEIRYVNLPFDPVTGTGSSVTILNSDLAVLYRVGTFEANFLKALAMILLQLAFLAAAGVLAGAFLSFPVACLVVFAVLPLGMALPFLVEATEPNLYEQNPMSKTIGGAAVKIVQVLVPNFSQTDPSRALVEGMVIDWRTLGHTALGAVGLRLAIVLAAACLVFTKRELARVQV